jgi:cytoskeletal protein RodZ
VGEFGNKFRKAREAKGISLDDVSNVTKIGSRMLQAIEEEHFDQLPGGVFNKGFIRAYAKHLGLNSEDAVTDYLACLRQAQIDAHEVWDPAHPATARPAAPERRPQTYDKPALKTHSHAQVPTQVEDELPDLQLPRAEHVRPPRQKFLDRGEAGIPWKIVGAVALILILGTILWIRHSRASRTTSASSNTIPAPAIAEPSAPTTQPASAPSMTPTSKAPPVPASTATPAPTRTATTAPPIPKPSVTPPTTPAQANSNNHPSQSTTPLAHPQTPLLAPAKSESKSEQNNYAITPSPKPPTPAPPAKPAASLTLTIRAAENSWISVTADGQPVSQETLIAPAHTSVRATREIVVKVGNAAGVTFLWNGQEVPSQGAEAEVKTFIFDGTGMRVLTQSQPAQ